MQEVSGSIPLTSTTDIIAAIATAAIASQVPIV
jgi:hypothetical protein